MPWVTRGLAEGIVTTAYPRRRDDHGPGFRASVRLVGPIGATGATGAKGREALESARAACPTGAIALTDDGPVLDRGRCIACGRCVEEAPEHFAFDPGLENGSLSRAGLVVPGREGDEEELEELKKVLREKVRGLRRSVHIRHVDCGSDGAEEWEIAALLNPVYDLHRLGLFFTASPRHADLLLVTGAGSAAMSGPLATTYEAMPHPKVVVAVGTDAISGGLFADSYATSGGILSQLHADVLVPGSPPSPFAILYGLLLGTGRLEVCPNSTTEEKRAR